MTRERALELLDLLEAIETHRLAPTDDDSDDVLYDRIKVAKRELLDVWRSES